jgi:DNA-formamidopyrimidine glycosylase
MPEVPEVRLLVKFLRHFFNNNKITNIDIIGGRYKTHGTPDMYYSFANNLPTKVTKVDSKGKLIYFKFDNGRIMWNTLGMSGFWTTNENLDHNDIKIETEKGNLYFNDLRHFGTIKFVKDEEKLKEKLDELGPDIIGDEITFNKFKNALQKSGSKKISITLMDQKLVSGIGNYLVSEILWKAKISPHRKVKDLTDNDFKKLYKYAQQIINKFIEVQDQMTKFIKGKTTTYKENNFKVYQQEKDPNGNIVKRESIGGRTKHWVPSRQK